MANAQKTAKERKKTCTETHKHSDTHSIFGIFNVDCHFSLLFNLTWKCTLMKKIEESCCLFESFHLFCLLFHRNKSKRHSKGKKNRIEFLLFCVCHCRLHNIHLPHLIKNLILSYCSSYNMLSDDVRITF